MSCIFPINNVNVSRHVVVHTAEISQFCHHDCSVKMSLLLETDSNYFIEPYLFLLKLFNDYVNVVYEGLARSKMMLRSLKLEYLFVCNCLEQMRYGMYLLSL